MRDFGTGATRNDDSAKYSYRGFFSWGAMRRFAQYMHEHRKQKDGTIRAADNWKKGISREAYLESFGRHAADILSLAEGGTPLNPDTGEPVTWEEALCATWFNVQGLLHERLLGRDVGAAQSPQKTKWQHDHGVPGSPAWIDCGSSGRGLRREFAALDAT